jgi:hypothetical protein
VVYENFKEPASWDSWEEIWAGCRQGEVHQRECPYLARLSDLPLVSWVLSSFPHRGNSFNEWLKPVLIKHLCFDAGYRTKNFCPDYNKSKLLKKILGWATFSMTIVENTVWLLCVKQKFGLPRKCFKTLELSAIPRFNFRLLLKYLKLNFQNYRHQVRKDLIALADLNLWSLLFLQFFIANLALFSVFHSSLLHLPPRRFHLCRLMLQLNAGLFQTWH